MGFDPLDGGKVACRAEVSARSRGLFRVEMPACAEAEAGPPSQAKVVELTGIEPVTPCLPDKCSPS
jgi:hypothetical protein